MDEESPLLEAIIPSKNEEDIFFTLTRDTREEILSYLSTKELFRDRIVSKRWKRMIEEPNSRVLRERYWEGKQKSDTFGCRKRFFKDFSTTASLLAGNYFQIGLKCPYGRVLWPTQCSIKWMCCFCMVFSTNNRRGVQCMRHASLFSYNAMCIIGFIYFSLFLVSFVLSMLAEMFRILFWIFSFCHCCRSSGCKCRALQYRASHNPLYQDPGPPYPTKEELLSTPFSDIEIYFDNVEEDVTCPVAAAICCFGGDMAHCCHN